MSNSHVILFETCMMDYRLAASIFHELLGCLRAWVFENSDLIGVPLNSCLNGPLRLLKLVGAALALLVQLVNCDGRLLLRWLFHRQPHISWSS